jgi:photosystem II stability/assembly factor-like uncharacterized protein
MSAMKTTRTFLPIYFLLLFLSFFGFTRLTAQPWMESLQGNANPNFYEIQAAFNQYWEGKTPDRGKGFKPFKRWENFWERRVNDEGFFPDINLMLGGINEHNQNIPATASRGGVMPAWTSMGPTSTPGGYAGLGRINAVAFHPTNNNIIWVGSPSGGLWKTTNGGTNWSTNTDNFSLLGVSGICVAPSNPDIIYVATGDGDAGDTRSIGVLKSTDGGTTWSATGLSFAVSSGVLIRKLVMDPNDENNLIAATSSGLYRTTNGGTTWPSVQAGNFYDVEAQPGSASDNFYACTGSIIYRSTNNGGAWTNVQTIAGSGRIALGVSNADNTVVVALSSKASDSGYNGLYRSTDSGGSYVLQSNTPNLLGYESDGSDGGGQGWYDLCVTLDPTNASIVYVGGVNIWKSTDAGVNWTLNAYWYNLGNGTPTVHADKHAFEWQNNNTLFSGNDGGIYKTTNGGTSWTDLSSTLVISQMYRLGVSQTNQAVITGLQDNGTKFRNNAGTWSDHIGGDGMECSINPSNAANMYAEYQFGNIFRTTNTGGSWTDISVNIPGAVGGTGAWITPHIISAFNNNTIYAAYKNVYKSTDQGNNWTQISTGLSATNLEILAEAPSDANVLYAGRSNALYRTTNGGTSWNTMTVPGGAGSLVYLVVKPDDANTIYAAMSNYTAGNKVYKSVNGGATWTNISGSLPNLPANCLLYHKGSNEGLYVGIDVGVYYRDNTTGAWAVHGTGLPNVIVDELDIRYATGKLRAATYGRGLWETDITCLPPTVSVPTVTQPTCSVSTGTIVINASGSYTLEYSINGGATWSSGNTFSGLSAGSYNIQVRLQNTTTCLTNYAGNPVVLTVPGVPAVQQVNGGGNYCVGGGGLAIGLNGSQSGADYQLKLNGSNTGATIPGTGGPLSFGNQTAAGTYTVVATLTASGCTANMTGSATITINPLPIASITVSETSGATNNDGTICAGGSATLTASGGISYLWNNGASNSSLLVTPPVTTAYTVTVTNASGCTATTSTTITVLPVPIAPTITIINNICPSTTGTISGSGCGAGTTLEFATALAGPWSAVAPTYTSSPFTVYARCRNTTTECVSAISSATTAPTVCTPLCPSFSGPPSNVSITNSICASACTASGGNIAAPAGTPCPSGSTLQYQVNGGSWSVTLPVYNQNGPSQTIKTRCSCDSDNTVNSAESAALTTAPATCTNPVAGISVSENSGVAPNDGILCQGGSVTLTGTGGVTYAWSTGASGNSISLIPTTTDTYTVTATAANGCTHAAQTLISVNPLPIAATTVAESSGNSNDDGIICVGAGVVITASGGSAYLWSTGATTASISVSPASTTVYTVTVTDANNCATATSRTITVNTLPVAATTVTENSGTAPNDGILCNGASATLTATGGSAYLWSTGSNSATIVVTPPATTTYFVTVSNSAGCAATASRAIAVNSNPTPAISVVESSGNPNDAIICSGGMAALTATGGSAYGWNTGGNSASINVSPVATTTYTVTVTNLNNCSATASSTISVLPQPVVFSLTGGGGYCQGSDPGVPVGLNGSQTGVSYQLQLNGANSGAAVIGTGSAISFGLVSTGGNYTVIATDAVSGCTALMTGVVTATAFNCNASISDPCSCLNNATTLTDGQFGEQIKVNAPSSQTWTVTAISGLFANSSPAPPAPPLPIPVGTVLTNLGGDMFTLDGRHIDALGYSLSVSNGLGTTLSIGNTCAYPNPSFNADLNGPFCLYSDPVTLSGNPGDALIAAQSFKVNGVTATVFNPGAGLGAYTIEYTVDGGVPKAGGAGDPGCVQKISKIVQVIPTPVAMACNNLVHISLDVDCVTEIEPDFILEGTYGCYDDYQVELDVTPPYGNGPWVAAVVGAADVGKTYAARVTHLVSNNKCWGSVKIEDKLNPSISCSDINLFCPITNYSPEYIKNTLGIATAYPTVSDCSAYTLTHTDTWHDLACGQGFNGVQDLSAYVVRKWQVTDAWGNSATCTQYIYFKRLHLPDVKFPADVVLACTGNVNTDPSATGAPFVTALGIDWKLFPAPGFCELQAAFTDQVLPVCDGTYKILRTWLVADWCVPTAVGVNPITHIQLIKVVDEQGAVIACPSAQVVQTNTSNCCSITDLPDAIIEDACSRISSIGAKVTTFDPYTGLELGNFEVGGTLTDFPGNNYWDLDTLGNWGLTPCLPLGTHRVVYTATDDCGNTSTCSFQLNVVDHEPPVSACDQYTVAAIGLDDPFDNYFPASNGCKGAGVTWIDATTFDDGSYDPCFDVRFTVRRMEPFSACINGLDPTEKSLATAEDARIKFYCCEVGTTQTVILRVYQVDANGQIMTNGAGDPIYNECMVQVEVQDKIKPVCLPPANLTVSCENFDPSYWAYGKATISDNCCLDETVVYQGQCGLSHSVNLSQFDTVCNRGTITRTFRAVDCQGQTSQCTQRVVVNYEQDYFVKFPADVIVTACDGTGNFGVPTFFGEDCELLGVSFVDQISTVVPDACFQIERTWKVINWCSYNPNSGCINVPNPTPNAISGHPSNLPGVTVSPLGTPNPWNPTVVKINASDPAATNYATFYQAGANCYTYKQLIKILDTQDPGVQCPSSEVAYCDISANDAALWNESYWWDNGIESHDLCEGEADLSITASDACSGSNLSFRYLLFLDLDGDATMETVVSSTNLPGVNNVQYGNAGNPNYTGGVARAYDARPVPANQKYRFGLDWTTSGTSATAKVRFDNLQAPISLPGAGNNLLQGVVPQLPYGTHKIKWFVEDGCGNETVCEYSFVVKDCKKPTVVCYNGLSANIGPTGVCPTLFVTDFLQYTSDNCTPVNKLVVGIRKKGTGTGFPYDANGSPQVSVSYDCSALGTQLVEIWSIDKSGNADYCETYVLVQDNADICPTGNSAVVAGNLVTEQTSGLEAAVVELSCLGNNAVPQCNYITPTNSQGAYNFNALPLTADATLTPSKDDDHLNGVSTYDLLLMSRHILGIESISSPYRMIAADANASNSITTIDIVEVRKLILGIYQELPNNTSWRFVDRDFVFPVANNPFTTSFPQSKLLINVSGDILGEDFVALKVGDVNGNAVANNLVSPEERSVGTLLFDVADQEVTAGSEVRVSFRAALPVAGYQFTLQFDGLELLDVLPGAGMTREHFGIFPNALTTSFEGSEPGVFTVVFKAWRSGSLRQMVQVSSQITRAEAYNTEGLLDVALRFSKDGNTNIAGVGFELYQNQPNPFDSKTVVGFHLPEASDAVLTVTDETGRLIYRHKGSYLKGYNSVVLDRMVLGNGGMLYYQLETAFGRASKKMMQINR